MKKKKNCPGTKKVSVNSQKVPVNLKIARELFFQKVPVNLASAREPFYEKVPVNFSKLPVNIKIMSGRFPTLKVTLTFAIMNLVYFSSPCSMASNIPILS